MLSTATSTLRLPPTSGGVGASLWRTAAQTSRRLRRPPSKARRHRSILEAVGEGESEKGDSEESPVVYNKDFGYSRKDVLIIGVGTIGVGYGLYYGLQLAGVEVFRAGSIAQLVVFVGILLTWVITYLFRVGTKTTTYVTQLKDYEEAVMQKRLDEMTEAEVEVLMEEVEREKREAIEQRRSDGN